MMATAFLRNIPHSNEDWAQWSFAHQDSHNRIRDGIKKRFGLALTDYQVDPMNPDDISSFLQNNSELHDAMNGALGLISADLQDVDLSKDNEKAAWIDFHFKEHFDAEAKLEI